MAQSCEAHLLAAAKRKNQTYDFFGSLFAILQVINKAISLPKTLQTSLDTSHRKRLQTAANKHGWRLVQDATMRILDGSSLYDLALQNRSYQNYIFGDKWEYVEVSFAAYGQRGLSRLKKKQIHYCVMRLSLPRKLPNIVFDSLEHQRRQFRVVFEGRQYLRLEGNFNKYFATYFGDGYTIDDLSFITPEVMETLLSAKDYDVEIVHDSLLLFGQIDVNSEAQIVEMGKLITLIRKKLLNNILTYRDERVPYSEGRRVVARAGMFLQKRPFNLTIIVLIFILKYGLLFLLIVFILSLLN